jgi:capsular exopolysaccharide synthesis family protein
VLSAGPDIWGLLAALQRRRLMAGSLGLLGAAAAAALVWTFLPPPPNTIRTKLQVPPHRNLFFKTNEPTPELINHQRTQVALVKSRLVLGSALNDLEVAALNLVPASQEPVEWLEKKVQVDFLVAPEVMSISMIGNNSEELVVLVNAIREAYLREVINRGRVTRQERLARLQQWRDTLEKGLKASRDLQNNIGKQFGGKNAVLRARVLDLAQQRLARFEGEFLKTQLDLSKQGFQLTSMQAEEKEFDKLFKLSEDQIEESLDKDKEIETLRLQVQEKKRAYEKNKEIVQGSALTRYQTRLEEAQTLLQAARKKLRSEIVTRLREQALAALRTKIVLIQREIDGLQRSEAGMDREAKRLREYVANLAGEGVRLEVVQEDDSHLVESLRKIRLEEVALQFEMTATTDGDSGVANVLEKAIVLRIDPTNRQLMTSGGAGAGALVLILLAIGWLEYRARRIDNSDELAHGLGMRLLGALPHSSVARSGLAGRRGGGHYVGQNPLAESVDAARAILLHTARQESLRVFLITSAVAAEGKTSFTCHLATSLARAGFRTLLIDADLRKPDAHQVFGVPPAPGFSELLRAEVDLASAIRPTSVSGLALIPAGHSDAVTIQALAQGRAGDLLESMRQQFDFILIDSSPVLPVADALLLGPHVDGALISVLRGTSRIPTVYAASQRIEGVGIRLLGAVISGVHLDGSASRYASSGQRARGEREAPSRSAPSLSNTKNNTP